MNKPRDNIRIRAESIRLHLSKFIGRKQGGRRRKRDRKYHFIASRSNDKLAFCVANAWPLNRWHINDKLPNPIVFITSILQLDAIIAKWTAIAAKCGCEMKSDKWYSQTTICYSLVDANYHLAAMATPSIVFFQSYLWARHKSNQFFGQQIFRTDSQFIGFHQHNNNDTCTTCMYIYSPSPTWLFMLRNTFYSDESIRPGAKCLELMKQNACRCVFVCIWNIRWIKLF